MAGWNLYEATRIKINELNEIVKNIEDWKNISTVSPRIDANLMEQSVNQSTED